MSFFSSCLPHKAADGGAGVGGGEVSEECLKQPSKNLSVVKMCWPKECREMLC